jgi:hypothetical protein
MSREQLRQQAFQKQQQQAAISRQARQVQKRVTGHRSAIAGGRTVDNKVEATFPDGGKANAELTFNASYQQGGTYPVSQAANGKTYLHNRSHIEPVPDDEDVKPVPTGPIKWLITTKTSDSLIVRIGGQTEEPSIALTLPSDDIYYDYRTNYQRNLVGPSWYVGVTYYFGFKLDLTGTEEDDWIISYGTFTIDEYTAEEGDRQNVRNVRTVNLHKVTPGSNTIVYSDTVEAGTNTGGYPVSWYVYDFYPTGYGGWMKWEDYNTVRSILGTDSRSERTETLYFNNTETSAFWTQEEDLREPVTGDSVVAVGRTRTNSGYYTDLPGQPGTADLQAYYNVAPLIDSSGDVGTGVYVDLVIDEQSTYIANGNSTVYTGTTFLDPENLIDFYESSVLPTLTSSELFIISKTSGIDMSARKFSSSISELLFNGELEVSIHKWDVSTGDYTQDYETASFFGFTIPDGETHVYTYTKSTLQLYFYPE